MPSSFKNQTITTKIKGVTMKKIALALTVVFGLALIQPVASAANESIVIIDTAIDSTRPEFKDKLIYEACFVSSGGSCPNGTLAQEGVGSATLPTAKAMQDDLKHGTLMTLIANQINPNVNIIFIRVAGVNPRNGKALAFSDDQVRLALEWVIANKTKFNIVSVSASVGTHTTLKTGKGYCPITALKQPLVSAIDRLITLGVPSMFASGNNGDTVRVDFPACIPNAVAVSASDYNVDDKDFISMQSNSAVETDFYALGTYNVLGNNVRGTSASAAALSAYWAKNYKGTYQATYDYLKSITKPIKNPRISSTLFVDILK